MSLTRSASGKLKPRGLWMPQFGKPWYYALKEFTEVLEAEQHEVLQVLLQLGAQEWQTKGGNSVFGNYYKTSGLLRRLRQTCLKYCPSNLLVNIVYRIS